ncbi:MAG: adenylate/guanylate cyclase domain-containing protein [Cyanobacteria bacterium J06641_5]
MAELKLRVHIEGRLEKIVEIDRDEFLIGRLPKCDLCLPYTEISRYHCRVLHLPSGEWLLEDMNSTNGCLVNQVRIKSIHKISHGDVIQVGNVFLFVYFSDEAEANQGQASSASPAAAAEVKTILRSAEELQQRWMEGDQKRDPYSTDHIANARLRYIVEIARGLSSAESIDAIFSQVQEIVLREIRSIERLALLIDIDGSGKPELYKAASRSAVFPAKPPRNRDDSRTQVLQVGPQEEGMADRDLQGGGWISRSICQKVFAERVAIKIIDARKDDRFAGEKSILAKGICGVLAVPLWNENQVVGVMYADARMGLSKLDPAEDQDLSFFSTIANLVASSVQRWLLTRKLQEQETIRQRLERYHSPGVVELLISQGTAQTFTPKVCDISVLFADIVGFTALSERLNPDEIAKLLNRFFEEMMQSLFATEGTLDKYIGDSIMAFFGAPKPQEDHADRAVTAAKGMLARVEKLNDLAVWPEPLKVRVAINSGRAVVGDVGSSKRVDYTVLGATVNLASRLEAISLPGECVISQDTYSRLHAREGFSLMGECTFKGIDRPIRVYRGK